MDSAENHRDASEHHVGWADDPRLNWLSRVWAGLLLVLLAATWRLWVGDSVYPIVPMVRLAEPWQRGLSLTSLALVVIGCHGVMLLPNRGRRMWLLVSAGLVASFVFDQHRLQPWVYQASIYGLVFALLDNCNARRWLAWLSASVYVYSAIGKFDFQFVHTVGQDFLRPALSLIGLDNHLDESLKVKLAFALPGLELVGGLGVLFHRTRRVAGCILIAMHVGLFVMLSPLGFHHSYGVLLWNVLLGFAAWELFVRQPISMTASPPNPRRLPTRLVTLVASFVILAPLAERSGYWDHWPSWALYSPHNSRVKLQVHSSEIESLPIELTRDLPATQGWVDIDLEAWSLESRGVPIYPQARYQLALASELAKEYELDDAVRCVVQSVSNRWTGQREETMALGSDEIQTLLQAYWLVPAS